jgi:outer membrane protein assembly factor BamA
VNQTVYREVERHATGLLSYALDRAHRFEFAGRLTQNTLQEIVSVSAYSVETGEVFGTSREVRNIQEPLNLVTPSAAFVSDSASFGPAGPIQGQRYRLEVSPSFGSTGFTGVLADYRRYWMPVSFYTIAARAVHYGRFGAGADDVRLHPLYLNDPGLVRGYNEFTSLDCLGSTGGLCTTDNRLVGSRIAVTNLELRFPLLRPFGVSERMYGPIPVEVAFFYDAGIAWSGGQKPAWLGGSREGISSTGTAFRIGLGVAALEFDIARPLKSSQNGWSFGLNLIPGW